MILTAKKGNNDDLFRDVLEMYVQEGSIIADVTYGRGVFWKQVDTSKYDLRTTDLMDGVDFSNLPYTSRSIDCVVLDPPYMHGGKTVKKSINDCYKNANESHADVMRLYGRGIIEAARVLKKKGVIIIKIQDEIESGKQKLGHVEVLNMLEIFGYLVLDLFVLVQKTMPAMRLDYQKTARKNHSYFLVARFRH